MSETTQPAEAVDPVNPVGDGAVVDADTFEEGGVRSAPQSDDALVIDVDGFEGPLDVLLALARSQKVDLAKISILPLAEQYLKFINQAKRLELDLAADYLVMAAWLAFLKSKLLLPPPEVEEGPSGEEMAARLAFQLQRLEAMRQSAAELMKRSRMGVQVFQRGAPEGIRVMRTSIYKGSLYDLLKAYSQERIRALAPTTMTFKRPPVFAIDVARKRLEKMLGMMLDWGVIDAFLPDGYTGGKQRRSAVASTFSAALELVRDGHLEVQQADPFTALFLRKRLTPRDDDTDDAPLDTDLKIEATGSGEQ